MSEQDRSRLAQIIRGPVIPPATPPKEPPRWNRSADMWKKAARDLRRSWDAWSVPVAKRHLRAHRSEWIAASVAGVACLALLAIGVRVIGGRATQSIQLQIKERQGQLQIRWDGGSDLIRRAANAKLFIIDGAERLFVTLDTAHLRRGTVSYPRQTERVEFRMALTEPDGHLVEQQAVFFGAPLDREEPQLQAATPPATAVLVPPTAEARDIGGHRSRRKPLAQTGTQLPFTCSTGDTFRKTDATPGWDTFTCRGNNVWGIVRIEREEERAAPRPNATTVTAKPASSSTT
jgi:hypothetical protein